eukprot:sb/3467403/
MPDKSRVCGCSSHLVLAPDGKSCKEPSDRILVTRGSDMLQITIENKAIATQSILPIGNLTGISAFDFHIKDKRIVVADSQKGQIASFAHDGTDAKVLVTSDVGRVEGLAVDWVTGQVFWTSYRDSVSRIEVVNAGGTARKTINSTDIEKARAICVDPVRGYIYWTDWGLLTPAIERSDMSGGGRMVFVGPDTVTWPNGLTLDLENDKIYWTEASLDYIGSANLDGTGVEKLVELAIEQPFGITKAGPLLIWAEWQTSSLEALDLSDSEQGRFSLLSNTDNLMTIHHYNERTQTGTIGF